MRVPTVYSLEYNFKFAFINNTVTRFIEYFKQFNNIFEFTIDLKEGTSVRKLFFSDLIFARNIKEAESFIWICKIDPNFLLKFFKENLKRCLWVFRQTLLLHLFDFLLNHCLLVILFILNNVIIQFLFHAGPIHFGASVNDFAQVSQVKSHSRTAVI